MRSRLLLLTTIVVALLAAALFTGQAGAAGGRPFRLAMSGAEEFNTSGQPGNPHGDLDRGTMTLTLNPGRQEVCWAVTSLTLTAGEALPAAAHIHQAPAGVAGPVVVELFGAASAPTSYPTDTTCVAAARSLIQAILQDPAAYYVNLHNAPHPGGVVRAQLG